MDNVSQVCHDLKTDRPDIGQPLPGILTFLPILFVLSVVGAIALNAMFFLQLKASEKATAEWKEKTSQAETQKAKFAASAKAVKTEEKRAIDVRKWVEGSTLLQPMILAITRSTEQKKTAIAELSLFRDLSNPDQVRLGLKFTGDARAQLDDTLLALSSLSFRAYQATQTIGKDGKSLDYQATLIKKEGDATINLTSAEQ